MRSVIVCLLLFAVIIALSPANAEDFQPTMLKLSVYPAIQYNFDCSTLEIPVTVSGTPCSAIFLVFTKDMDRGIEATQNGYLGWHYVNGVDTCLYFSQPHQLDIGENIISWDGRDQDGIPVFNGVYTYYIWAYDNMSEKQQVCNFVKTYPYVKWKTDMAIQEVDEAGLPLANPFWYRAKERWIIGHDPLDEGGLIKSNIVLEDGWDWRGVPHVQSNDFDNFFISVGNGDEQVASIQKVKFVPGGDAEIDKDFGEEEPYAGFFKTVGGTSPGVVSDGTYLFTADDNKTTSNDPDSQFYIYDMDGFLIEEVDLSSWWSSGESYDAGGQMNGGPSYFYARGGFVFLNSNASCLVQMIDPMRYLDSGNSEDLIVWSNGNGDYVYDRNFEETAYKPWVCNDYNVPYYTYSIGSDRNYFSISTAWNSINTNSFGLLAPDGTGLGYFSYSIEGTGPKNGNFIIDSNTPYDGLYCDNLDNRKPNIEHQINEKGNGIFYIGHDSVKGIIDGSRDMFGQNRRFEFFAPVNNAMLTAGSISCFQYYAYFIDSVKIEFSSNGGVDWATFNPEKEMISRTAWRVPNIVSDDCYFRVSDANDPEFFKISGLFSIVSGDVTVNEDSPTTFTLSQNMPNPFNSITTIPFIVGKEGKVTITVYDVSGKKAVTLADGVFPAGNHSADWNAAAFASGVYFCRMEAAGFSETRKMTALK